MRATCFVVAACGPLLGIAAPPTLAQTASQAAFERMVAPAVASCDSVSFTTNEVYRGKKGALLTHVVIAQCPGRSFGAAESSAEFVSKRPPSKRELRDMPPMLTKSKTGYVLARSALPGYREKLALAVRAHCRGTAWLEAYLKETDMAVSFGKGMFTLQPSMRGKHFNHVCWPMVTYRVEDLGPNFLENNFGPRVGSPQSPVDAPKKE